MFSKVIPTLFFLFWLRDWFEWIGFWPFDNQIYILILNLDTGFKIWRKLHFFTLVSNTFQEKWGFWRNFGLGFLVWFRFHEKKFFLPTVAVAVQHTGLDWGTGRQNGGIATDALARSIHNRVSRLISPKKVDLLLNVDIYYSISEYYLARYFLFHL